MSQARLPRTEPSTELISAHKVNHRAAHVAGHAPGIFAKVRSHRDRSSALDGAAAAPLGPKSGVEDSAESGNNCSDRPVVFVHVIGTW